MTSSPLALCAVAFAATAGWLFLAPRDDEKRGVSSPPDLDENHGGQDKYVDVHDILKRAPPPSSAPTSSPPAPRGAAQPTLTPQDPEFHTQHLKEYEPRPALLRRESGEAAKPSLGKIESSDPLDQSYVKPAANGRSVNFAGGPGGSAATSIASRPAEEQAMGADLRLWSENQELSEWVDPIKVRTAADGEPAFWKALDGSCSPLRLNPGMIPENLEMAMKEIEDFCHQDWLEPLDEASEQAWAKCLVDCPHAVWGNAPYWVWEMVTALVPLIPLEPLLDVLHHAIPASQAFSPAEILERGNHPAHDLLLAFFMIPFRACVSLEWTEPDKFDKRGNLPSRVGKIREALDPVGVVAIEWLHYIARPFLISRMFSGRGAEILDGSMRIGIFANASLRGYIADITVFAPVPSHLPDGPLIPRGWQTLLTRKGHHLAHYAIGRCLNLARQWIDHRLADTSGIDRFGYQRGGDPLVWNRLCIRPGHILDPNKLEATKDAGRLGNLPKSNASAHIIPLDQSQLDALLKQEIYTSAAIFRQIVEMTRPARLSFSNYRQNAWHSDVKGYEVFDAASFAFMWMLCTDGLRWMVNPGFGVDPGADEVIRIPWESSMWTQLDLGGIVPQYETGEKWIDMELFPNITEIVLPWLPIGEDLSSTELSTASLLIDPNWGFQAYFLGAAPKEGNGVRSPVKVILLMPDGSRASSLFEELQRVLADRAGRMAFTDSQGDTKKPRRRLLKELCAALKQRVFLLEESNYRGDLVQWPYHPPEKWTNWNPTPGDYIDSTGMPLRGATAT